MTSKLGAYSLHTMVFRLTLNPGASPFPYGPLVFATHVQSKTKVDIQFDVSVDKVVLEHDGTQVPGVVDIVNYIAKESNYASDSAKVHEHVPITATCFQ